MCDQIAAANPPTSPDMNVESEEENKLRSKYPMLANNRAGVGSMLLQKRLNKGHRFFDSGDYNMAMAKYKMKGAQQAPPSNLPSQHEEPHHPPAAPEPVVNTAPAAETTAIALTVTTSGPEAVPATTTSPSSEQGSAPPAPIEESPEVRLRSTPQLSVDTHAGVAAHRQSIVPEVHPVEGAAAIILQEATGDTIPTPDNVPAVVRKKSLLAAEEILLYQQHHQRHIEQQAEAVKLLEERLMNKSPLSPCPGVEVEKTSHE